jgi:hypothetical protein
VFLYCSWQLVFLCLFSFLGVALPLLLYPRGQDYKEGNRVGYNMIPIMTLSLLAYFTYISIDIIIYALGSMSWSSGIFWLVGRVIADPSLGLLSPCRVVPRGTNPRQQPQSAWQVNRCWVIWIFLVHNKFVEYSILRTKYSGMKLLSAFSPNWSNRGTV